jgi:putative ABC transport system substrate-binding protein
MVWKTPRRKLLRGGFISLGVALLAGCGRPLPGAQPAKPVPRLGYLSPLSPPPATTGQAFLQALQELGYVDGQTISIDYRWAEGREERLPELAAELVASQPDVIYGWNTLAARAAMLATSTIPIVFGAANDPVGAGLVTSLARPGGNVTGPGMTAIGLSAKRVQLLKEVIPSLTRIAVLGYADGATTESDWTDTVTAGRALGLSLRRHDARTPAEIDAAFGAIAAEGSEALVTLPDSFLARNASRVVELAARYRLPAVYEGRQYTSVGGMMSYGADIFAAHRRAATYVDRILKGAKPADLPVERATTFDFSVNLKTAQQLGLTISQTVLQQATEIIQ